MTPFLPQSKVTLRTRLRSHCRIATIYLAIAFGFATSLWALPTDSELSAVDAVHNAKAMHANQEEFRRLVVAGEREKAFELTFEEGDELFATVFNALDGVGANVGQGQRFTRVLISPDQGNGLITFHHDRRAPTASRAIHAMTPPLRMGPARRIPMSIVTLSARGSWRHSSNATPLTSLPSGHFNV